MAQNDTVAVWVGTLVLREAMTADSRSPAGVYIGTTGGHLFHTADGGKTWAAMAEHLPPIISVSSS